jgi:hypothetical protein
MQKRDTRAKELSSMTQQPLQFPAEDAIGARVMASAWTRFLFTLWQGDSAASDFAEWLASYWQPMLERPTGRADARSPFGTGATIAWYERDGWISGHIPGQTGGYLLPRETVLAYPWLTLTAFAA